MRLSEALNLVRGIPSDALGVRVHLACGFSGLHLKTFLAAEIWATAHTRSEISEGLYGDFLGSMRKAAEFLPDFIVCALEWPDFDPRLSLRTLGGWSPALFPDIAQTAKLRMQVIERLIDEVSRRTPVVLQFPTLPLPPISFTAKEQAGSLELELRACLASSAVRLAGSRNVRLLNLSELDRISAPSDRLDVKSELATGFPYSLTHAAAVAATLARLISDLPPKKGLITDLDDTLWRGVVGEVGIQGISWTLEAGAQIHGLYQQLLCALGESGVLIAVASKNDPKMVEAALARHDLALNKDLIFPVESGWEPKSRSVARILRAWNISADSVVFVDDSPAELAEVAESHPGIRCCQFPTHDYCAAYRLLEQLRDSFGKGTLLDEDRLRAGSLRRDMSAMGSAPLANGDDFFAKANPELTAEYSDGEIDPRALELINKTNQFNLNGKRHTLASLSRQLQTPGGFMMVVSYKDKYGPLGKIAVLCGTRSENAVRVVNWVMSCRAFSRRIEHWCLEELFRRFGIDEIILEFQATDRNGPLQDFLTNLLGGTPFDNCKIVSGDFFGEHSSSCRCLLETYHG